MAYLHATRWLLPTTPDRSFSDRMRRNSRRLPCHATCYDGCIRRLETLRVSLSDQCARGGPSLRQSRARVLGQGRRAGPCCAARILIKEMLKQHCGEQCYTGKSGASKHSARPGGDLGLIGLGELNMKMWSHDYFFPSDRWMGQTLCGGEWGLRGGDFHQASEIPALGTKMKLKGGNNSVRAEVMEMSCAVNPQDQAG